MFSFWSVLTLLVAFIASTYIVDGKTQQSAYGDDWNDLGDFRSDINAMGVETTAMVSSPLLLGEIDNPDETVFVISGVERDTISLPRFTDDDSVIELSDSDGYTGSEIEAIVQYVQAGGTLLLMDDFGYSSALAQEYNIVFSNHQLYDGEAWARELDYNGIYRLSPEGEIQLLERNQTRPNGIVFSPDEETLYVANSDAENKVWYAYTVIHGIIGNPRVFYDVNDQTGEGAADGMKVDIEGNIFATGPGGVWIFDPDGTHLGTIKPSEVPANVAWGDDGSTLYMTARTGLYRIRLNTSGEIP